MSTAYQIVVCAGIVPDPLPTIQFVASPTVPEWLETDVGAAERILREELQQRRWQEADRPKRARGNLRKAQVAGRLQQETLVPMK